MTVVDTRVDISRAPATTCADAAHVAPGASWNALVRGVYRAMRADLDAVRERDPAARSRTDAALNSPGLHAVWAYRIAHSLWQRQGMGMRMTARLIMTVTRAVTGVDIHPAARIGCCLVIDHGMGVVIGETAIVGDRVHMYHGATLGARRVECGPRHPHVGNDVMIGAGAKVLGPITIGDGATIGANAVVTKDVPAGALAVGVPAEIRRGAGGH